MACDTPQDNEEYFVATTQSVTNDTANNANNDLEKPEKNKCEEGSPCLVDEECGEQGACILQDSYCRGVSFDTMQACAELPRSDCKQLGGCIRYEANACTCKIP